MLKRIRALSVIAVMSGITVALPSQVMAKTTAEVLFDQAVNKTQKEDYRGAIADLQKAANLFNQQRNYTNAYKSNSLALYLRQEEIIRQRTNSSEPIPNWYKLGQCLGKPICQYSLSWLTPNTQKSSLGGILVLEKPLRMLNRPDGSAIPINAVLDVKTVSKVQAGESLMGNCKIRGKVDPEIFSVVQTKGFETANLYTKVRQAWRTNLKTQKIEVIPTANISCINPCPSGC